MCGVLDLDAAKAERMAALLKAVAHPVRLKLLALLRNGEDNVSHLTEVLQAPQAAVSSQLAILRMNGLVAVRREHGFAWYHLDRERLGEVLTCLQGDPGLEDGGPATAAPRKED
jgi:DNA-binding transcriptional ArsR family regulator